MFNICVAWKPGKYPRSYDVGLHITNFVKTWESEFMSSWVERLALSPLSSPGADEKYVTNSDSDAESPAEETRRRVDSEG